MTSRIYRSLIRPALFEFDSEQIHDRTLRALSVISRSPTLCELMGALFGAPALPTQVFGLQFPNPIGLAAGMDKHGAALPIWAQLGFGFCELGGVTWHPQPGNPKPRMFRVAADGALINRMGFNNPGAAAMAERLAEWRARGQWPNHPVGINLGKSKITPLDKAADDYAMSLRALYGHGDFFVVNVSSPNTPNLRQLQDKSALDEVLAAVQQVRRGYSERKPILVKVAPDLSFEALDEIVELTGPREVDGIVATNTTITRPPSNHPVYAETGGLSGRPLAAPSTEMIRHLGKSGLPIIGVGGIFNAADAYEKLRAGASLVQVYTGLVYEGPAIAREIVTGLKNLIACGSRP
ncbi:MAG TPA: quinone-dependent dihydroorotate dehydrogenase [Verrucomicrobiae bacterium]|nr:quinone-dependent dihydroorotate dehydrogenase [Verrucomicrobiae bacterium]